MFLDYLNFSLKTLTSRKIRSWLTMIGIFIGIAAVVSLIALGQGMQNAIEDQFLKFGADKLLIQGAGISFAGPPGSGVVDPITKDDLEVISRVRGVKNTIGRLIRSVKVEYNDKTYFEAAVSFPKGSEEQKLVIEANQYEAEQGRLLNSQDKYAIVVGSDFATKEKLGKNVKVRDNVKINGQDFRIVGILKRGGDPQRDGTLMIPESTMRDLIDEQDNFDVIVAQVVNQNEIDQVEASISKDLRRSRGVSEGKEDFSITTPKELVESLGIVLTIVQAILVGIAAISLLVGGIGIMNTMYTAVVERTKEIGIMKSIGARNETVLLIFLLESGILGFIGGLIGVILGVLLSKGVEFVAVEIYGTALVRANLSFWLLFGAMLFSVGVGMISGVLPARQASRMNPVDALRSK